MTEPVIAWQLYPWQMRDWQQWRQRVDSGRVGHALLISGKEGIGKAAFAWHIAAMQLCEQPQKTLPCQQCAACHLLAAHSHPNLWRLSVAEDEKTLKIDAIREAMTFLQGTSSRMGPNIVLIETAERMPAGAANALLKTLEEPPTNSLLILITAFPGQLLPTIRSRCQQLILNFMADETMYAWLAQHNQLDVAAVMQRLCFTQGAPLRISKEQLSESQLADFLLLGQGLSSRDPQSLFELNQLSQRQPLSILLTWWERWLILYHAPTQDLNAWPALTAILQQHSLSTTPISALYFADKHLNPLRDLLVEGYQVSEALQFEALLFAWCKTLVF